MKKILISLSIFIMCGSSLFGQLKYTFTQFGDETWDFIKQPVKWEASDYLKIGIAGAGTFLLMETVDQPIRDEVLKAHGHYYRSVPIEFGRMWGELYTPVVLFSGFAIHSLITDDIGTRKIAYEIGQASIYTGVVTYLLKFAIGRARPYTDEGSTSFHPFNISKTFSGLFVTAYQSTPGGHSSAAFVVSTVLSRNAKPVWLKVLAYLPAALTFVSRIYQDRHWTSDDFIGAAIGYSIATWVVNQHENSASTVEVSSLFPLAITIKF